MSYLLKNKKAYQSLAMIYVSICLLISCSQSGESAHRIPEGFQIFDDRLNLSLLVEDPDIVTPVGIAIDSRDRVFVLESHTHLPPKDYDGPTGDKIKVFADSNGDGNLDSMIVFAEGIKEGLNIAFSPKGHLYVVTSKEVWAFYDKDGDGISEESRKLLGLTEPEHVYAHAAILSIAFSTDGWMYIGRGNTGGARWVFQGSDGSKVSGYGDGGNIMRSKLDGSQLEEFATGFWNPFDLKFDNYGRLMVADNDPDSRGPNRLIHAVKGGDYGYKSIFGGSGIHPYSSWNGELPGTLPYAVALGEAPSGLLNASYASLPIDYQNQMLCTIWEESNIVRINIQEEGISVRGDAEVIISGGEDFRPVAFATDSKGDIYFTDWVLRDYPNHGRGRIWKISTKENVETLKRRAMFDPVLVGPASRFEAVFTSNMDYDHLEHNLKSSDPFIVHAAVTALSKGNHKENLIAAVDDADPDIRLGVLLALQKSGDKEVEYVTEQFLADPDLRIRNMALIWIGSSQITDRRKDLERALSSGETSTTLFETYLETVKLLQPDFVESYKNRKEPSSKALKRALPDKFVSSIVSDPSKSPEMRIFALRYLENPAKHKDLMFSFLKTQNDPEIRLEALRTLANYPDKDLADMMLQIALDGGNSGLLRSEAILTLTNQPLDNWQAIIPLLHDDDENIRIEAARYLRPKVGHDEVRRAFEDKMNELDKDLLSPLKQQLELGLSQKLDGRPPNTAEKEWQELLATKGDIERGQRVFYSNTSLCSTCHAVDGRGGDLGPDLSNVGQSKDKNQLISSILLPSNEISPEWQGWYIQLKDGTLHQGRQIDVGSKSIRIYTQSQGFVSFEKKDIEDYGLTKNSLMPEGLERMLTDQDLRDLLAFLQKK